MASEVQASFLFVIHCSIITLKYRMLGSGCGSDGRAVTFDTGDPWFESSYQQISFDINCLEVLLKRRK